MVTDVALADGRDKEHSVPDEKDALVLSPDGPAEGSAVCDGAAHAVDTGSFSSPAVKVIMQGSGPTLLVRGSLPEL